MRSFFILVALCASCVVAQKINTGGCPDVPVKADFDISKYVGDWYEIEKNPAPFEYGLKCMSATYENKGDYVSVINRGINIRTGKEQATKGKATVVDKNVPAKLKVDFNMPIKGDYWILDTDYENYSVVYSCINLLKLFNLEYLWILSRQKTLDDATQQKIYKLLDDNKINRKGLVRTQQDC